MYVLLPYTPSIDADESKLLDESRHERLLSRVVRYLQLAQRLYYTPFEQHVVPKLDATSRETAISSLRRTFNAIVSYSLPFSRISVLLETELSSAAAVILGVEDAKHQARVAEFEFQDDNMDIDRDGSITYRCWRQEASDTARIHAMNEFARSGHAAAAREKLLSLLEGVRDVGLGGERAQKVFAEVMNVMMTEYISATYAGQWDSPSSAAHHLRLWTENVFARFVIDVLTILKSPEAESADVSLNDVNNWHEMAIARLGALRTSELFDIIVDWDESSGAIEDLKYFTSSPRARLLLATEFIGTLNRRLLHPGASTVEILQAYISIIRAFNLLDPKGVLLHWVARPIRRYLKDRDDTIKAIVSGLLAEPSDAQRNAPPAGSETLTELSVELNNARQRSLQDVLGELDWDDMNWTPDPVDAAPDYSKSREFDVIGSLTSLFESKEAFVTELKTMLSERLLRKSNFDQEISVLELLKMRFGDDALQACEVMLHDMTVSAGIDSTIHNQKLSERTKQDAPSLPAEAVSAVPELHAKILSRFFWPSIQDQPFNVPDEIAVLQERYKAGFESVRTGRKLSWLNSLGQVTVELELEDRVFSDKVTTWQATVIYAFQSDTPGGEPVTKTVAELSESLSMSASLVRSACLFWVGKRILTEVQHDTFRVLEVLPNDDEQDSAENADVSSEIKGASDTDAALIAAESAAAAAAKESAHAAMLEKMHFYWQFVVGMLTNQGPMPLQRIVMMLKIAVPGGFPFSDDELKEYLAGMVSKGKLEIISGGNYKIIP